LAAYEGSGRSTSLIPNVQASQKECRDLFGKRLQHCGERATRDLYSVFCKAPASKNVPAMFAKGLELAYDRGFAPPADAIEHAGMLTLAVAQACIEAGTIDGQVDWMKRCEEAGRSAQVRASNRLESRLQLRTPRATRCRWQTCSPS
jgi:hypothetical protein